MTSTEPGPRSQGAGLGAVSTGLGAASEERDPADRVLTVPNLISVGRLLCVPVFLWLLFGRRDRVAAAVLLGFLGATDWVDGWIARRYRQVSTVGKVLDPAADRILLGVAIVAILVDGAVPAWVAWGAVARELLVSVAFLVLLDMGARSIDVQCVGKAGTLLLMFAFPLFLPGHAASWPDHQPARMAAWVFALPGLLLSWYSAAAYIPIGRKALQERKVGSDG